MTQHIFSVTQAHDKYRVPLRGDMQVALNEVVNNNFSIVLFTETFERFKITTSAEIKGFDGEVGQELEFGGRPGLSIELMFNNEISRWYPVLSSVSPIRRRLSSSYPWEIGYTPQISISANKTSVTAAGAITLTADVQDINIVEKVEFYKNGSLLLTDDESPYSASVMLAESDNGTITYTAKMYNVLGQSFISNPVTVDVMIMAGGIAVPTVDIVADKTQVTYSDTVVITATASDDVGVTRVEWYRAGQLVGTNTTSPYVFNDALTFSNNGDIDYVAKAYDASDNVGTSNVITVSVNIPVPHTKPATLLDSATQAEYDAAIAGAAPNSKRLAAANALVNAFKPDHRLYVYQDGFLVVSIEYSGDCVVVDDGYDIYIQPAETIDSSDVAKSSDLSVGSWWFELQGGNGYSRIYSGSVGPAGSNADLIFMANPQPGQGIIADIKITIPRSLDGLS